MPAFSVATNGDLACFARGINVVVAADRDQARRDEISTGSRKRGQSVNRATLKDPATAAWILYLERGSKDHLVSGTEKPCVRVMADFL